MNQAEFDKFADEYTTMHSRNIRASGESPEFFAEYKVRDVAEHIRREGIVAHRILDFGAGIGGSVPHFRHYLAEGSLTCIDVSEKSLEIARARFPGAARFLGFDGSKIPFADDEFDVVFTACVFHHIPTSEHVPLFTEIRRVLKPGGMFFIFEHNPLNPLTVKAVNECPFDENAILIRAGHLRERLADAGFEKLARRYRIFFPRALAVLRRFEAALSWCPAGAQYYFAARK